MSETVTIYHNPRCSKSRQALEILEQEGIEANVVQYLLTPPDAATLNQLLQQLGLEPRELMRKGELIAAMVQYPRLIERPIVVANGQAVIGRPPEKVLDIL